MEGFQPLEGKRETHVPKLVETLIAGDGVLVGVWMLDYLDWVTLRDT